MFKKCKEYMQIFCLFNELFLNRIKHYSAINTFILSMYANMFPTTDPTFLFYSVADELFIVTGCCTSSFFWDNRWWHLSMHCYLFLSMPVLLFLFLSSVIPFFPLYTIPYINKNYSMTTFPYYLFSAKSHIVVNFQWAQISTSN